jgi:TPR repeat protein
MTTVPGTCFTKEQLEAALRGNAYFYFYFLQSHSKQTNKLVCVADNVSGERRIGGDKLNHFGYVYQHEKQQYDKALAWYLLAAMENNSIAQNNIGTLYRDGLAVPKNYLCAMKWFLKSAEQNEYENTTNSIGKLFENGYDVPLDKYKALEWYCHGGSKTHQDRLKKTRLSPVCNRQK